MYRCVTIDPPWNERGGGKIKRGADRHYPLMTATEIASLTLTVPHLDRVAPDATCWLWVTNNHLEDGFWVLYELGFRYVTNLVWVKDRIGLGQYLRGQHELCLLGVRGRGLEACTQDRTIPSVLVAPRRAHSEKPEEFYTLLERRCRGEFLDIFARKQRPGWTCWGNEV